MVKRSERGRPLCKDEHCDVEITAAEKYCAAHSYQVRKWVEQSRKLLAEAKDKSGGKS